MSSINMQLQFQLSGGRLGKIALVSGLLVLVENNTL